MNSMNAQAKAIITEVYKGAKNIMTPNILAYGVRGKYAYELSEGTGIRREPIFGVTVVTLQCRKVPELSKCFMSREEAENHIRGLS